MSKILLIGDAMLDRHIYGSVERLSPEAPVPVLSVKYYTNSLGGAAKVFQCLAYLGAEVEFITVLGPDAAGKIISEKLKTIACAFVDLYDNDRRSTVKSRLFSQKGEYLYRFDEEDSKKIPSSLEDIIVNCIEQFEGDIIALSDYNKGVLTDRIIGTALASGKRVVIDPKRVDWSVYKGAFALTPNKKEYNSARNIPDTNIVVTCGEDGVLFFGKYKDSVHFSREPTEVVSTIGAGDAFIAALVFSLSEGKDISRAAKYANRKAASYVGGKFFEAESVLGLTVDVE